MRVPPLRLRTVILARGRGEPGKAAAGVNVDSRRE